MAIDNTKNLAFYLHDAAKYAASPLLTTVDVALAGGILGTAKFKRAAKGEPVVDAFDIDWAGYSVNGVDITYTGELIELILAGAAAASAKVALAAGVTVTDTTDATTGAHTYTIGSNLVLAYNAAVANTAAEGLPSNAKPATITLKSAVRAGEDLVTYGTVNVSDIIGNGILDSSSYAKETGILTLNFKNADGTTNAVSVNLAELLDINDIIIDEDSKKYLEVDLTGGENSQAKFSAKIQNISTASPAIDNTVYDAKIKNSENVATITYTGNTLSGTYEGNTIQFDEISIKTPLIVDGEIVSYNTSTSYINHNKTLSVGTTITSSDRYSEDEVEEMVAAYSQVGVLSAFMHEGGASYEITKINDNGIPAVTGLADAIDVKNYVDLAVAGANSAAEDAIKDLDADITSDDAAVAGVEVKEVDGKITDVVVTTKSAGVNRTGDAADTRVLAATTATGAVTGADIASIKGYVDDVVSDNVANLEVTAAGDNYITAQLDDDDNKKINITADVQDLTASAGTRGTWSVTDAGVATLTGETAPSLSGTEDSLVDGADVASKVKTYVDAKVAAEAAERDAKISAAVKALDVVETEVKDADEYVKFKYSETDGKVSISNPEVKTVALGDAVGLTKATEGENAGKYVAADGTVGEGLVTAGDVAAEIVADEKVIAAALNDHEARIVAMEEFDFWETFE